MDFFPSFPALARRGKMGYNTRNYLRQHSSILMPKSLADYFAIFHKNTRQSTKDCLRFLFHLTKNLTACFTHQNYAVLP